MTLSWDGVVGLERRDWHWENAWVKKLKKKNNFTLILQREGLGMYLCLINGGGDRIFAVNKLGVISQRYLPGKLTGSPHRDTT